MSRAGGARWTALLVAVLVGLAGCVSVPTSGPVEKVEGQQPTCQSCVAVDVRPPVPGDDQRQIVDSFLRANASYQPNYAVARQFLSATAAATWDPEQGADIYHRESLTVEGDVATLHGTVVGSLGPDRTFRARNDQLNLRFHLVRQPDGEWRIDKPPPGLVIADFWFENFYRPYDLYYVGSLGTLVPEPIYLPDLRAPANTASALVKALLEGPSDWLAPAARSAIPPATKLSVDAVILSNGTAQVPLSDDVLQVPAAERRLLAAQVVSTLAQVVPVQRVLLQAGNQPFQVPQSEPGDYAVPVGSAGAELDPVSGGSATELYAVRGGRVVHLDAGMESASPEPGPGDLGRGRPGVESLAVSTTGTDLAVVTEGGTVLSRTPLAAEDLHPVLRGVTGLRRPQFARGNELWALGARGGSDERGGRQQLWRVTDRVEAVPLPAELAGREVTAFRISPDGARMALLVRSGGRTRLGIARVVRTGTVRVERWRALDLASPLIGAGIDDVRDVGWLDATELVVLARSGDRNPYRVSQVRVDASQVETNPAGPDGDPVQLATLLSTPRTVVVRTRDGAVSRDDSNTWHALLDHTSAIAFPG